MSRLGSWLGVFAIAMLFIGPPIGQWRAQLALQQVLQAPVVAGVHAGHASPAAHAQHAGHAAHSTHAEHSRHAAYGEDSNAAVHGGHAHPSSHAVASAASDASGMPVRQHGVLQLDHCGYCHMVATFAALPAALPSWPPLRWASQPWVARVYPTPVQPLLRAQQARAPPLFHT